MKNKILITGGAGYIGSHVAKQLLEGTDYEIIILDNLSTGSIKTLETLKMIRSFEFIKCDLNEFDRISDILSQNFFDIVFHFAASIVVPESVIDPLKYFMNNTVNTTNLIKCAVASNVAKFIFSSTAAVYGEPIEIPKNGINEDCLTNPINPYGLSKLMSEQILQETAKVYDNFKYVIFRYFNVAGADIHYENSILSPRIGQSFPNATHLIKIAAECASNKREKISIFGDTYSTEDGTCIRDYIHVDDLANAHVNAIKYLQDNKSDIFNLGYGKGCSVKEVIDSMKYSTNSDFEVIVSSKRKGDPANLISDNSKYKKLFSAYDKKLFKFDDLKLICKSAYSWENKC